jgi:predicted Zn-dependent peptidase
MRVRPRGILIGMAALAAFAALSQRPLAAQTGAARRAPARPAQNAQAPAAAPLVAQMPPPGPPRAFHFPAVESVTLPNGLRVFVIQDSSLPLVTAALVLPRAGSLHDPPGLAGLARTTAALLTAGTATRSAEQIAREMDSKGGSISALADHDDATAVITVLKSDFGASMPVLADVVLHPSFPAEELDRVRRRQLSALGERYADPGYLASAAFERVVYGTSRYGMPTGGTPQSVASISRDDVVSFYKARYSPSGALLALAGDITPAEGFAAARKYFGSWSSPAAAEAAPAAPAAPKGLRIFVIDQPRASRTEIRVGRPAVARRSADAVPLFVAGRIFAGGYDSLLNAAIRGSQGLILGANSSLVSRRFAGSFVAAAATPAAQTVPALQFVIGQIGRMSSGDFTQADLDRARRYLTGVYPLQMETPAQVLTRVVTAAASGLPADFNATYPEKLDAITLEQLKALAARYFDTKDLDVVLAGNADAFRDALKKAFPGAAYEEIPSAEVDLLLPELHQKAAVVPAPTPATLARGRSALEAAARAAGGQALAGIRSLRAVQTGHVSGPQGTITVEETYVISYPGRIHSELGIMDQKLIEVLDGDKGWMASGPRSAALPSNQMTNLRRRILLAEGVGIYQAALGGSAKAQWLGEEEVHGHKLVALEWQSDTGPVKLYIDPTTHLVTGVAYAAGAGPASPETVELWSDFRPVNGIQFPFQMVGYEGGAKFMDATVKQIEINVPVDPKLFIRPKSAPATPPQP